MEHIEKFAENLMVSMRKHSIGRLALKDDDFELELECLGHGVGEAISVMPHHVPGVAPHHAAAEPAQQQQQKPAEAQQPEGKFITSPVVGTFYVTLDPKSPPCVKVGDTVDPNTVVGVIEAMKVMNEVKAGVSGVIAEVLVENGHPVEYDTKLFRVV